MLMEGVFAGSKGPLLYEGAEIRKAVMAWNHRPITVGHPVNPEGKHVSGCVPDVLENVGIGMILNTKYTAKDKKLRAEAWIDETRLDVVPGGAAIKKALLTNTIVEVSTGLFTDMMVTNGDYGGRKYIGKAVNHTPDHLAILLYERGSCNTDDGAGLLANQEKVLVHNRDAALTTEYPEVYKQIQENNKDCADFWVEEITANAAYFHKEGKLWQQNFAVNEASVTLDTDLIEVKKKTSYDPVVVANESDKVEQMDRTKLYEALGDEHKDFVANLSDAHAGALITALEKATKVVEVVKQAEAPVINSAADVIGLAPASIQETLNDAMVALDTQVAAHIQEITANKANQFTEDELKAMRLPSLAKLAQIAVANKAAAPAPKYAPSGKPLEDGKKEVVETGFLPPSTL